MARTKSVLGDVRRDERAEWMLERIVASRSLVLRAFWGVHAQARWRRIVFCRLMNRSDRAADAPRRANSCSMQWPQGGGGAGYDGDQFRSAPSSSFRSWSDR